MMSIQKFKSQQKTATNKHLLELITKQWSRILNISGFDTVAPLLDINIYHVNKDSDGSLRSAKYPSKGFTVLVFNTPSEKYYSFAVCNESESVFDRKAGVYETCKKVLSIGVLSFGQLGIKEEELEKTAAKSNGGVTANQLFVKTLGYYLLNDSLPTTRKDPRSVPISNVHCNALTDTLLKAIMPAFTGTSDVTVQYQYSQVRLARDQQHRVGLATSAYLKKDSVHNKYELCSKSGLTLFIVTLTEDSTGNQIVWTSFAKCSEKDVFNKAFGRLIATRQFAKNKAYELHIEQGQDAFDETIKFYSNLFEQYIAH